MSNDYRLILLTNINPNFSLQNINFEAALGEIYLHGHKIHRPAVEQSGDSETPKSGPDLRKCGPVGHVVTWDHSQSWYFPG